jgi:hypothetical protein
MKQKLLTDLFKAYFDARRHKRKTLSALKFELNYEAEIFRLYDEIVNRKYKINRSICFISFSHVTREIFAGDFRDRIIHHLVYNYLNPFFERIFVNDSFSCRNKKGVSYGIKRANHFIRSCSNNYKKDCYILKLDVSGYFMSIDKKILFDKIKEILKRYSKEIKFDSNLVLWLIEKIIFNDPTINCVIKGKRKDWIGLPKSKSLFYSISGRGLPIGNLTSQLFANLYLNDFDRFVKCKLKCKYYGRYVDDILIIHKDKSFLMSLFLILDEYLQINFKLRLHPKKIYLEHFKYGVLFLGRIILPYRMYLKNMTKGNIYKKFNYWSSIFKTGKLSEKQRIKFLSCYFSYSGVLMSCNAYNLRQKFMTILSGLMQE